MFLRSVDGGADGFDEFVQPEGFGEEACLVGVGGGVAEGVFGVSGDEDDSELWVFLGEVFGERDAIHARHNDIADEDVDFVWVIFFSVDGVFGVSGGQDEEALIFERARSEVADCGVVLNEQHRAVIWLGLGGGF